MILTLAAGCVRSLVRLPADPPIASASKSSKSPAPALLTLKDLPRFARDELLLNGILFPTSMLAGIDPAALRDLRDAADKSGCPILVLNEEEPLDLGALDEAAGDKAADRLSRVVRAAHLLACAAVAVRLAPVTDDDALDRAAERIRPVSKAAEKMELNLLVAAHHSFSNNPDTFSDLLKKVGGFRIGTLPDFDSALKSPDHSLYLRRLTPYASCVIAPTYEFKHAKDDEKAEHTTYDLPALVSAIAAVGYEGPLAIDYRGSLPPARGVTLTRAILQRVAVAEDQPAQEAADE